MTSSEDRLDGHPAVSDLERNPGIGESKGAFATGESPQDIEGENTVEGDIENDPDPSGRVNADRLGRTNK